MSRDNFWFTRVVGIRIRNEAPPDTEMGPGIRIISNGFRKARFPKIQIAERSEAGTWGPCKTLSDLTVLAKKNNGVFPVMHVYEVIDGRLALPRAIRFAFNLFELGGLNLDDVSFAHRHNREGEPER